ncbi:MAG: hypothetical protein EOM93_05970 [Gammaproteobacteria bacterium]|nr:hypothetical protein [Gammaproteobacteria bacterium]
MARTGIAGESAAYAAGAAIDTNGYGKVTILLIAGSGASGVVTLTDGDTSTAADVVTADNVIGGVPSALGAITIDQGTTAVISYIGSKQYVKPVVSGSGAIGAVLLSESRYAE